MDIEPKPFYLELHYRDKNLIKWEFFDDGRQVRWAIHYAKKDPEFRYAKSYHTQITRQGEIKEVYLRRYNKGDKKYNVK